MSEVGSQLADLEGQIEEFRQAYPKLSRDQLFVLWFLRAYVTENDHEAVEALSGGSGDKNIDALHVDDNRSCIFLVQAKYRTIIGEKNEARADVMDFARCGTILAGQDDKAFSVYLKNTDPNLAKHLKIARERILKRDYRLWLYYVTLGKVSTNLEAEATRATDVLNRTVSLRVLDGKQIMRLLTDYLDGVAPPIPALDLDMEIGSSVRVNGILQRYDEKTMTESWVFSMRCSTVADLVRTAGVRLFARNIRAFLGESTPVNRSMISTLEEEPEHFYYYNNGITIVCDNAQNIRRLGKDILRVHNPQIINGLQTAQTLEANVDKASPASVLVRVIQISREGGDGPDFDSLVRRIVKCTNWQNAIRPSDLVSNDRRQVQIEREFRKLNYLYVRKRQKKGEALKTAGGKYFYVIQKNELAQAVAGCDFDPRIARSGKENLFEDEWYDKVFPSEDPDFYLPRYLLMREVTYCARRHPNRGYAKWMVLGFVWSHLESLVSTKRGATRFRKLCEDETDELVEPLHGAIEQAYRAAMKFYKANRGRGAQALDISLFFKNKRGLHKQFAKFLKEDSKSHSERFQRYWASVESTME